MTKHAYLVRKHAGLNSPIQGVTVVFEKFSDIEKVFDEVEGITVDRIEVVTISPEKEEKEEACPFRKQHNYGVYRNLTKDNPPISFADFAESIKKPQKPPVPSESHIGDSILYLKGYLPPESFCGGFS